MPISTSHQVGHFFNVIRHHDGCRLVHPAKWDIGKFWDAFVTDADGASRQAVHSIYHSIHIYDGFRLMNPVLSSFTFIRFSNITFQLSRPRSWSDPIGESEPVSGCETIYWDSSFKFIYLFIFFFRADLICGIQIIFVITSNHLYLKRNYHQSGIH